MPHGFKVDPNNTDTTWHPWIPFKLTLIHQGGACSNYYNTFRDASVVMPGTPDRGHYHQCIWPMIHCHFSRPPDPDGNTDTTGQTVTIYLKTRNPYPFLKGPALFASIAEFFFLLALVVRRKPIKGTGPAIVIGSSTTGSHRNGTLHEIEVYKLPGGILDAHRT